MMDEVDRWRAELGQRHQPEHRVVPLIQLGQALAQRYWRLGPWAPEARAVLDEAIDVLGEGYRWLQAGDVLRAQVGAVRGCLLAARHSVYFGSGGDQAASIPLLEEARAQPGLPGSQAGLVRMVLAQQYLTRAVGTLTDPEMIAAAMRPGGHRTVPADLDRAIAACREVLGGPAFSRELTDAARSILNVAEAIRPLLGGAPTGSGMPDLGAVAIALQALQDAHQSPIGAVGPLTGLFDADALAMLPPLDRPVAVISDPTPAAPGVPRPPAAAAMHHFGPRQELPTAAAILDPATPPPDIDALVAAAATVAHGTGARPTDRLRLAAALHLRDQRDGYDEWSGDGGTGAVLAHLEAAADPALPATEVPALLRLAARLNAWERVRGRFPEVLAALRGIGADALLYPGLAMLDATSGRLGPAGATLPRWTLIVSADPGAQPAGTDDNPLVSYVDSDAALLAIAARPPAALGRRPVFVVNPRGDRPSATLAAVFIRRTFHWRSTGLGQTAEDNQGPGTPRDVLRHLDASLLHLDCAVDANGALELAGPARLTAREVAGCGRGTGGLAILPPGPTGSPALAAALLAAGYTGVIGWSRPVPEAVARQATYVLHAKLIDDGLPAVVAARAVRDWLRTAAERQESGIPTGYPPGASAHELSSAWPALVHWGR